MEVVRQTRQLLDGETQKLRWLLDRETPKLQRFLHKNDAIIQRRQRITHSKILQVDNTQQKNAPGEENAQ